jgi:hypothetical protein
MGAVKNAITDREEHEWADALAAAAVRPNSSNRQVHAGIVMDAEYDLDRAITQLESCKTAIDKFRSDSTDDAIDDAINGLTDLISDLRGARASASADAWNYVK